jgi:hypothetical protein
MVRIRTERQINDYLKIEKNNVSRSTTVLDNRAVASKVQSLKSNETKKYWTSSSVFRCSPVNKQLVCAGLKCLFTKDSRRRQCFIFVDYVVLT